MFYQAFPDLTWLKNQAESHFANRKGWNNATLQNEGWPTVILNVKAGETFRDNIPGPLSLFSTLQGQSSVTVEGRRTTIPSTCFFLTNPGQRYTLEIDRVAKAETFNIHFGNRWAEDTLAYFTFSESRLTDEPQRTSEQSCHFYNKLYYKGDAVARVQSQLIAAKGEGVLQREEILFELLAYLVKEKRSLRQGADSLPLQKSSTREEIMRRLFVATDFIYSDVTRSHSLNELAAVSCLSRFHFLRMFKQVFRETPHQFATRLRVEQSKDLLRKRAEVRSVARQLGFSDPSSFSRLFFQHVGMYPTQYLKAV